MAADHLSPLSAAFGAYDRTLILSEPGFDQGGLDLQVTYDEPSTIFHGMLVDQAYDIAEMSGAAFMHLRGKAECPFVGIPVFPSRAFRHSMVHVASQSPYEHPSELNGGTIVIREWGMTAVLWIVGIMQDDYGFDFRSVNWITEQPARAEIAFPPGVSHRMIEPGETVRGLLAEGTADAALVFDVPPEDGEGCEVRNLFADYQAEERRFFQQTRIHPPMHTVVARTELIERIPNLPGRLFDVMSRAKALAAERLLERGTNSAMVPFLTHAMDDTVVAFGDDWWPYGVEPNAHCLERMCRYAFEQGLTRHLLSSDALFPAFGAEK